MATVQHFSITRNFLTDYFCVYGTLRAGMNNNRLLGGCEHVGTYNIAGLRYNGGLSASYSGNPADSLTVDIFKVPEALKIQKNIRVDALEGIYVEDESDYFDVSNATHEDMSGQGSYYNFGRLDLEIPARDLDPNAEEDNVTIMTKFYHMPFTGSPNKSNDYCYYRIMDFFVKANSPAKNIGGSTFNTALDTFGQQFPKSYAYYENIYNSLND